MPEKIAETPSSAKDAIHPVSPVPSVWRPALATGVAMDLFETGSAPAYRRDKHDGYDGGAVSPCRLRNQRLCRRNSGGCGRIWTRWSSVAD